MKVLTLLGILWLLWLFLSIRHRRLLPCLGGFAILLGVSSYLFFDRAYILLNLTMHDAQSVRKDCIKLLQDRRSMAITENAELRFSTAQLPSSFIRLGAKDVWVRAESVLICYESTINGGAWGFLYDPKRVYARENENVRPTLYRDFYKFLIRGE